MYSTWNLVLCLFQPFLPRKLNSVISGNNQVGRLQMIVNLLLLHYYYLFFLYILLDGILELLELPSHVSIWRNSAPNFRNKRDFQVETRYFVWIVLFCFRAWLFVYSMSPQSIRNNLSRSVYMLSFSNPTCKITLNLCCCCLAFREWMVDN